MSKRWGILIVATAVWAAGCGRNPPETKAAEEMPPAAVSDDSAANAFHEAPMLARLVAKGELPPVSERLPENPLVVKPLEETGVYGGTLRRAIISDTLQKTAISKVLNDNLMAFERPLAQRIVPNLAESVEVLDGGKQVIFRIRKGIKWSDGAPFTVDDILFWYYDILTDPEANETGFVATLWQADGEYFKLEKVEDTMLRVTSHKPMGPLFRLFANDQFAQPKHVLAQLHPRYDPAKSYDDFRREASEPARFFEPGIPKVSAWIPVDWKRGQRLAYERNPYYWKVDMAGNQLPYADRIVFQVVPDPQVILLKFLNGELDLFGRYFDTTMMPVLKSKARDGRFRLHYEESAGPAFYLNWDAPNPMLREAFRNLRVRMALSHAINREEVGAIIYHGHLKPSGYSFSPGSPYYSAEAARAYSAYEPKQARQLLDKAGYRDTDGDGFREFRDGSRFTITIDVESGGGFDSLCELAAGYWEEAGVEVHLNHSVRENLYPRRVNGEFEAYVWTLNGSVWPPDLPQYWAIIGPNMPYWHRTASTEGPEWLKEATRHYEAARTTMNAEELRYHMEIIRDLHTENVPVIALGTVERLWAANTRLGNVPEHISYHYEHRAWGYPLYHEQIFIRE